MSANCLDDLTNNECDTPKALGHKSENDKSSTISGKSNNYKWTPVRRVGLSRKIKTTPTLHTNESSSTPTNSKSKSDTYKWTPIRRVGLSRKTLSTINLFRSPNTENKQNDKLNVSCVTPIKLKEKSEEIEVKMNTEVTPQSEILSQSTISVTSNTSKQTNVETKPRLTCHKMESKKRLVIVLEDATKKVNNINAHDDIVENNLADIYENQIKNNKLIEELTEWSTSSTEDEKKKSVKRKLSLKRSFKSSDDIKGNFIKDDSNCASNCVKTLQVILNDKQKEMEKKLKHLATLKRIQSCENLIKLWKDACIMILEDLVTYLNGQQFNINMSDILRKFNLGDSLNFDELTNTFK